MIPFLIPEPTLGSIWGPRGNRLDSRDHFGRILERFWSPLGTTWAHFSTRSWQKVCSGMPLGRFWVRSQKNIEICRIPDPLRPFGLSSLSRDSSIFNIPPEPQKSPKMVPKKKNAHFGHLWHPQCAQESSRSPLFQ